MKWIIGLFVLNLLLFPLNTSAKSFYSDGTVDNSDGTTNKELVFRDFEVSQDGYITGHIINESNRLLKSVKLDMWTTNRAETQIFVANTSQYRRHGPKGQI